MKKLIAVVFLFALTSCASLFQMNRLAECEFAFDDIVNVDLAGVKMDNITKISSIGMMDAARLAKAYINGDLPMKATALIIVENPNKKKAAINKLDWKFFLDGKQVTEGSVTERFEVAGQDTAILPVDFSINLGEAMGGENKTKMLNFVLNMVNAGGKPSRIDIYVKPSIMVAGKPISYPGFIKVKTELGDE